MTPQEFYQQIILPGMTFMAGITGIRPSMQAAVMLTAIAGQESFWTHRVQLPNGPAHGFWQFEAGGGVKGVMTHPLSMEGARAVCAALDIPFDRAAVYGALPNNDTLALAFARLLLWTDPEPLPTIDNQQGGWAYYQRNWRPGKPHPETWPARWADAVRVARGFPS